MPFRSAVATARWCGRWMWNTPSRWFRPVTQSTGIKSIAFITVIQQNTISASGAIHERSPWMMPLAWSSTISTIISTKAWKRPGTPGVTRRAAA